ncbi:hypothetical protein [Paenibacillus faecalis]|uniref:hypothetical protein n=1 Tax=Paenibacillus faecalis TaxID=2079532 RepID=UPI000D102B47|nr:hypothetical protein [Paenibacillus faecalis]
MSYRPQISNVIKAGSNEKEGLYEFIISLADGTDCRVFYSRLPEWKMTYVNRLGKTPCPVCRKDFICNCMEKYSIDIDQQMKDGDWFNKASAE